MATRYPREQMHRIKYTKLTPEQILGKLAPAANGPVSASPLAEVFAGKSLKIVLIVHTETEIGPECTVVEMAKAQGEGVVRWSESVVLENSYIRRTGGWKILRSTRRAG